MTPFPPKDWYPNTIGSLIDEVLPPILGPLSDHRAWAYVYACALWTESHGDEEVLHVNDRLATKAGREQAAKALSWMSTNFLADGAVVDPRPHLDKVYKQYQSDSGNSPQRNNITGRTFEVCLQEVIERLCGVRPAREPRLESLEGFELSPPGYHSQPDLALFGARDFRLIVSTKWTLRKERIGTYLHESWFYKRRRQDLQTVFVVSDFSANILGWLVNDPLVDRVYHVSKPMLLATHLPFGDADSVPTMELLRPGKTRDSYERYLNLSTKLHDLSDLFTDVRRLKADTAPSDPIDDLGPDADLEADETIL